jgi:hypothetical protein
VSALTRRHCRVAGMAIVVASAICAPDETAHNNQSPANALQGGKQVRAWPNAAAEGPAGDRQARQIEAKDDVVVVKRIRIWGRPPSTCVRTR